jgi:hypothetical protein
MSGGHKMFMITIEDRKVDRIYDDFRACRRMARWYKVCFPWSNVKVRVLRHAKAR